MKEKEGWRDEGSYCSFLASGGAKLEGLNDIMAEKWGSAERVKWYNKT